MFFTKIFYKICEVFFRVLCILQIHIYIEETRFPNGLSVPIFCAILSCGITICVTNNIEERNTIYL